jgi:sulfur carrier protein ThiS
MRVEVRLYATLRRYAPSSAGWVLAIELPEGSTAADAIRKAGVDANEVHVLIINGVSARADQVLAAGDRLGLFPSIGGG